MGITISSKISKIGSWVIYCGVLGRGYVLCTMSPSFSLSRKSWYRHRSRSSRANTHQQQSPDLLRTTTGLRPSRLEGCKAYFTTVKKSCVCASRLAALCGRLPRLLLISEPTLFPTVPAPLQQWQAEENQASRTAWQIVLSSALRRKDSSTFCRVAAVAPFRAHTGTIA